MTAGARVTSLNALRDMKVALAAFVEQASAALTSVDADIARMSQWLNQDRPAHFKSVIRRLEEEITRAKSAISMKENLSAMGSRSVVDERKHLQRLQARLEDLSTKRDNVRKWAPTWDREAMMYKSSCRGLTESLQADLPAAIKRLERMATSIEQYWALQPASSDLSARELSPADLAALSAAWNPGEPGVPPIPITTRDKYGPLRILTVSPQTMSELMPLPVATGWEAGQPAAAEGAQLLRLAGASDEVFPDSLVFVAWRAMQCPAVYFVRRPPVTLPAGLTDSGWFIGPVEEAERPAGYGCFRVGALLDRLPGLKPILGCPVGMQVVLAGGTVKSVLDADDREVWAENL